MFDVDVELKSFSEFWNLVHPTHQPINDAFLFKYLTTLLISKWFTRSHFLITITLFFYSIFRFLFSKIFMPRLVIELRFHFDDLLVEYQCQIETGNRVIMPQSMADVLTVSSIRQKASAKKTANWYFDTNGRICCRWQSTRFYRSIIWKRWVHAIKCSRRCTFVWKNVMMK